MLRRSQLFVPANDEKKIRKSVGLEADSIIFDLEDAVPVREKAAARNILKKFLEELDWGRTELCVRINKIDQNYSLEDMNSIRLMPKISTIVLPKAELVPGSVKEITGARIIALVETALGLLRVEDIARASGVEAISFGPQDFANSVGGNVNAYSSNVYVKTLIAVSAKAYGLDAVDGVYFKLSDLEGFRSEAMSSKELGFVGKQVVHPSQIAIANEVYSTTPDELAKARRVVEIYEGAESAQIGAVRLDDMLVDAVHYRNAKSILERAKEARERKEES